MFDCIFFLLQGLFFAILLGLVEGIDRGRPPVVRPDLRHHWGEGQQW